MGSLPGVSPGKVYDPMGQRIFSAITRREPGQALTFHKPFGIVSDDAT